MDEDIISSLDGNDQTGNNASAETQPIAANDSSGEEDSFRTCDNAAIQNIVNAPPEFSDDSDRSDTENSSDLFLTDNNDNDSDISDPGRGIGPEDERSVETSFQRELLDYLGSLFNVNSRIRSRDIRQPVTVSEDQLQEYKVLREKVDKEMKILGVKSMMNDCSSDQSIARNLYYLLAARERGDWSGARQYMRVIPMWSFETNVTIERYLSEEDSMSLASSNGASDISSKMEVKEEMKKCEGNSKIEEDLFEEDDKGICTATNLEKTELLNRGAELWAQEGDEGDEGEIWKEKGKLRFENNNECDQKVIRSSADELKDDVKEENNDCVLEKMITDTGSKETMDSGVFKRSYQICSNDECENNLGLRECYKKDEDMFMNASKKCKLDLKEGGNESVGSVILKQVSRVGQRDIKSAIYGSRWSVQRLGLEARFPVHEGCVNALHFSSSGDWIASGSDDREVVITDWQKNIQVSRFSVGHSSNIFQVRFLPGSNDLELVTCSRDRSVRYAALSTTGQLQYSRVLAKHNEPCHKIDMPIDEHGLVISAGEDCRVLWSDVRGPKNSGQLCVVDKVPLYSVSCNPVRSQEFCVAGKDNRVYIFDRRKPKKFISWLCPETLADKPREGYHVTSVVYSGDGNSVLASYNDEDIYLLSVRQNAGSMTTQHKYVGHRNVQTVTGVSFYGPNQEYIVSGSNDGHVLLWERDSEALVNWFLADEAGVVNVLQPHPFMPVLATSGLDHDIKLWSMLAADRGTPRVITIDDDLIDRDQETSRIDLAWKTLADKTNRKEDDPVTKLPFNLRNLQVITALNWKMRSDAYPYSFDNTLENLIFMSRRHGENQLRNLFISDSDSGESYETVPNIVDDSATGAVTQHTVHTNITTPQSSTVTRDNNQQSSSSSSTAANPEDRNRPDGCRSS